MGLLLDPEKAKQHLLDGKSEPVEVQGLLDLRNAKIETISSPVVCHDLDATGSKLKNLRPDIQIKSSLKLDDCKQLEELPDNLECGSISLRSCTYLKKLPENLKTWFLELSDCSQFESWPENGMIHRGILRMRNCIGIQSLPGWLGLLGCLDVAGCVQLNSIPEGVCVRGWLDIGGTNIVGLPESLSGCQLRWRGVPIDERIAFRPESLEAKEVLSESNAEVRRVMIERMGYLRFAEQANAKVLDRDNDPGGKRELLRIELNEDEPLVGLSCFCPSTGRQYFLRVPPKTKSCHQAAAWMAGFDNPKLYKPVIET